jgi:Abnormal spindle-like microcephaly-assoc'd, ASPM-SPD-2-Hydin
MMTVAFQPPNGPGVFHAQLQISSDGQNSPLIIPLSATALNGPTVTPIPSQTDFGNVAIGSTSARTVTITNNGDYPLQIQGWFTSGGTPSSFPVTADGCSGQQVNPGSSCPITVSFQPTAVGYRDATILLITSTKHGIVPVAFAGTGTPTLNGGATITGNAAAGSTLTCNPVGYPPGGSYQYQWLRASYPVAGADAPTLIPSDTDVGHRFACRIATTNSGSTQTVTSPRTAPIAPMTLTGEPGAFTGSQTCRTMRAAHLQRVGHHLATIHYGRPMTPWAPLTVASGTSVRVHLDRQALGRGKTVTITPRTLSTFADGVHKLTIATATSTTSSQLLLLPCQLAVRLQGGPGEPTSLSASSRYGIRTLTIHLPRRMHLHISHGRDLGTATYLPAGEPPAEFDLIGPRTSWNNVRVILAPHTVTVTNLPIQTGIITINLRPDLITGHTGTLTATAKERGSQTTQTARTPTSWYP